MTPAMMLSTAAAMTSPIKILLQTTIPFAEDDWHIGRFSLLAAHLASLTDTDGSSLFEVEARNRMADADGNDGVLSSLDESDFGELWLFALDNGDGLTTADCEGITRFRQRGGGILTTRDHHDMGSSLCTLGGIGAAHYFYSRQREPDPSRHRRDDSFSLHINWPNYHSGFNGDFQRIVAADHELMRRRGGSLIEHFPAHPHEGAVGVPDGEGRADVIATGRSKTTGRPFNLVVALERSMDRHGNFCGRAIAQSSFHHLVDYNWDPRMDCPSFVDEPPGTGYRDEPEKLSDIKRYIENAARWLAAP